MAGNLSERDICTKSITPAILLAGWDLHTQIREEFLHQGQSDAGPLVLRAPLPSGLQELLQDQADAFRGVRPGAGVVDES